MAQIELPYGNRSLPVTIPDEWLGEVTCPQAVPPAPDIPGLIAAALDHPIGSPSLSQLVGPGQTVALIVDDYTRKTPVPQILPLMLQRLLSAGVMQEDICIVVALGTHRQMSQAEIVDKVGADVAKGYKIVNIPSSVDSEMVYMGRSSNGIPAWVSRSVAEADVRLALGMISPHLVTGFSGGAKIILPGVCSTLTVDTFHSREADNPTNQLGKINAPLRRDLEQFVGERVPLDFIVNVITTPDDEIYQCVAGHFIEAHRAGVTYAKEVFGTHVKRQYPVVIANCYPYQYDLWQSTKGLWCGELLTANGGTLVLVTQAEEGNSNYPLFPHYIGRDPDELKVKLDASEVEDPKAAASGVLIGRMKQRFNLALVSDGLTQADANIMGISYYDTVEAAIEAEVARLPKSDQPGAVGVFTHAGIMLPMVQ